MIDEKNITRRTWLTGSIISGSLALMSNTFAGTCTGSTPAQTEGPFYPIKDRADKDNDLTVVKGKVNEARGERIVIEGQVMNQDCKPIKGAIVEIWQACASGRYSHPGDTNTAKLDPNFQYWGRAISDEKGKYQFLTIKPGAYPASTTWIRPPHIHVKVHLRGHEELTTQLYFKGDALNLKDRILQNLTKENRELVLVEMKGEKGKIPRGSFNLVLNSI